MLGCCIALAQLTVAWCDIVKSPWSQCTFIGNGAAAKRMLCCMLTEHLHRHLIFCTVDSIGFDAVLLAMLGVLIGKDNVSQHV